MIDLDHSNHDVIDSRDVIERLNELQDEIDTMEFDVEEAVDAINDWIEPDEPTSETDAAFEVLKQNKLDAQTRLDDWMSENGDEYKALKTLDADGSEYASDWRHGETLIHESYFKTYAEELANDIGAIDSKAGWPLNCIDWGEAAEQLKFDYAAVDFHGDTFYIRSS